MAALTLIPAWACAAARDNVGKMVVEEMAQAQILVTKAVRCRQCGQPIPAGEEHVAFYYNFTEWRRWMFVAHIHRDPCQAPAHRAPACQITWHVR